MNESPTAPRAEPAPEPNLQEFNRNGPPTMDGWPYPVRPAWIHDLLELWERNKPLVQLLELASDRVAQDLANASTRRRTLLQITMAYVPLSGDGRRARTLSPNPWAAFSQLYTARQLAPAYLVHLADRNDAGYATAWLLHHRYQLGDPVALRDVRRHLVAAFGSRPTARASAGGVMRTLAHFGVMAPTASAGHYTYADRLPVDADAFPLLMWAWWRARRVRVIRISGLADDPLLTFLDLGSCAGHWAAYDGALWTLETRDGEECAVMRVEDNAAFIRTLFNLLSSHPKWPTVARQDPEP